MKIKYRLFILFVFCTILIIFVTHAQAEEKKDQSMNNKISIKALVVIYSYTGNTKAVADEIIKRFKADIIVIKAKKYKGFIGRISAVTESWNEEVETDIKPEVVDMSQYNLIFLGSPIWWYRPAVPLWTFVEKNNFKGKRIVLFNTFNSKFESKYIEKFEQLIQKKDGIFNDHIYVRRGRWFTQLSREELLEEFNKILDKKEAEYIKGF
jgi:flavodoxin